ncbi:hypothetical protein [Alloprevotella rava]|uniref:hypothetical protein n=1 Tax=Alloprevotella rava TaxID=671218 RepID=UPI00058CFBC3|nr:hypothetical protein [Alloprevotella rava]
MDNFTEQFQQTVARLADVGQMKGLFHQHRYGDDNSHKYILDIAQCQVSHLSRSAHRFGYRC